MVGITACMIGKNEEALLPQCLESIRKHVDEIIFVDTGSTDATVSIAESFGAKVYHHAWENDFSLHRNQSISYASNEWIFIIDCDEKLINGEDLKRQVTHADDGIAALNLLLCDMDGKRKASMKNQVRLFRKGRVKYSRAIHNRPGIVKQPGSDGWHVSGFPDSKVIIEHYGYALGEKKDKEKIERTKSALLKAIEENPEDWDSYFYLSQIYAKQKDIENCLEMCRIYHSNKHKNPGFLDTSYVTYLMVLNELHDEEQGLLHEFIELLNDALSIMPHDLDINYIAMCHFVTVDNPPKVLETASTFCRVYELIKSGDARALGNKFVFFHQPEKFVEALAHLAIYALRHGVSYLNEFRKKLSEFADCEFKGDINSYMEINLKKIGVKEDVQYR